MKGSRKGSKWPDDNKLAAAFDRDVDARAEAIASAPAAGALAADDEFGDFNEDPGESDAGDEVEGDDGKKKRRPRPKASDLTEGWPLWCDSEGNCYASVPDTAGVQHWPVDSKYVRRKLAWLYYGKADRAASSTWLKDAVQFLEAKAFASGVKHEPRRRVCEAAGCIFVDLGDNHTNVIKIDAGEPAVTTIGEVAECYGVYFVRSSRMQPMPLPEFDERTIDALISEIANFADEDSRILFIGALVGAYMARPPYFIVGIHGEQGAGKSFLTTTYKICTDNGRPLMTPLPDDERKLMLALQNSHVAAFDNGSALPSLMSDLFCGAASGTSFAVKLNYTDREENIYSGANPIILNGIPTVGERPDFNDRCLRIALDAIPETARRTQAELEAARHELWPFILGAIFTAVGSAVRNRGKIKFRSFSRLADLEQFVAAAEPGLGWEAGTFSAALARNRESSAEASFESDLIAQALFAFARRLAAGTEWEGTATRLLELLNEAASDSTRKHRNWPQKANNLGNAIVRAMPLLRRKGVYIGKDRSKSRNLIIAYEGAESP